MPEEIHAIYLREKSSRQNKTFVNRDDLGPKAFRPMSAYERKRGSSRISCASSFALNPKIRSIHQRRGNNSRVTGDEAEKNDKDRAPQPSSIRERKRLGEHAYAQKYCDAIE